MNRSPYSKLILLGMSLLAVSLPWSAARAQSFIGDPNPTTGDSGIFAFWNFNNGSDATSGTYSSAYLNSAFDGTIGSSASLSFSGDTGLVVFGGTVTGLPSPDPDGTGRGVALAIQNGTAAVNNGSFLEFSLNLTGLESLGMSFAGQRTNTGFDSILVSYSTDGGVNFTELAPNTIALLESGMGTTSAVPASIRSVDFSGITSLNGAADARFRFTFGGGSTTSTAGNNRFDNWQFTASLAGDGPDPGNDNTSVLSLPATSSFGRVMSGANRTVVLGNTGDATTYAAGATDGFTAPSSGAVAADGSANLNVGVGTTLGNRTGTLNVTNAATTSAGPGQGSDQAPLASTLSATVVQNRQVGLSAAPDEGVTDNVVNVGKALVGVVASGTGTITTSGADDENTRVTVNAGQTISFNSGTDPLSGGTGLSNSLTTAANAVVFDSAASTMAVTGEAVYGTSGSKTGNFANLTVANGALTGEGLASESVRNARVYFQADIYQAAEISRGPGQGGNIASGGTVSIDNAATSDGGQRASAEIVSRSVDGDANWSVAGLGNGTVINADSTASGTANFDSTGRLNGVYVADFTVGLQHADQSILGTSVNDLGSLQWRFQQTVSGNTGGGTAGLVAGQSLQSFSSSRGSGLDTSMGFLDGTLSVSRDITVGFADAPPGAGLFSDIVNLTGLSGERFVLSLTYDPGSLGSFGASDLLLGWEENGSFVNAVFGNSENQVDLSSPFQGGWGAYQLETGLTIDTALGAYGVNTADNSVWAVLDHNSSFAAVPEPSTYALLALAGAGFAAYRIRRRARL